MSSPNLNNIIVVGCVFAYLSVFLLGTDGGMVPARRYHVMCSVSTRQQEQLTFSFENRLSAGSVTVHKEGNT